MRSGAGKRRGLLALCLLGLFLFASLGIWQVERLGWKHDLIARVNARLHAAPVDVPGKAQWARLDPARHDYQKVRVRGAFLHERETLVDALTERGPGFWVITPLVTPDGVILINRGFVPPDRRSASLRAAGQARGVVTITGLIRLSEPDGRILRPNDPGRDRWYSRDVAKIAAARGLRNAAPFFIDADAAPNPGDLPVGGMTIVRFRNAHLVYALTWFALAGLCGIGMILTVRQSRDDA